MKSHDDAKSVRRHQFSASFFGALAMVCGLLVIALAVGGSYAVTNARIDQSQNDSKATSAQFEAHLCQTLNSLKALKPPPGDPKTNPSRAFDVQQHIVLAQLAADLGCPSIPAT